MANNNTNGGGVHLYKNGYRVQSQYLAGVKIYEDIVSGISKILNRNYPDVRVRTDFSQTVSETTTGVIYKAEDSDGDTFYFAGNPTDNWFYFGRYYWRIVRINGDGTLRLIYQGTVANETGEATQIGTSAFNTNYNDKKYVGYMYDNNSTPSTIYTVLNNWFKNSNLKQGSKYFEYIDKNAGFINDKEVHSTSSTIVYYKAYDRLYTNKTPSLNWTNASDLFTYKNSNKGNLKLENPVGLITADEVSMGGAKFANYNRINNMYYTNQNYWTMTASRYKDNAGLVWSLRDYIFDDEKVSDEMGIRPVINLRADITLIGSGTKTNPYKIKNLD